MFDQGRKWCCRGPLTFQQHRCTTVCRKCDARRNMAQGYQAGIPNELMLCHNHSCEILWRPLKLVLTSWWKILIVWRRLRRRMTRHPEPISSLQHNTDLLSIYSLIKTKATLEHTSVWQEPAKITKKINLLGKIYMKGTCGWVFILAHVLLDTIEALSELYSSPPPGVGGVQDVSALMCGEGFTSHWSQLYFVFGTV